MLRASALARFAALACAGVTLTACSGGGGSSGDTTPPAFGTSTASGAPAPVSSITPQLATAMAGAARAVTAITSYDYRHLDAAMRNLSEPSYSAGRR
jgi:hypothetical protein